MISIVLYGRNDNYGYNLHKRAALSLNCMAAVLTDPLDEILFVDYNTPDDFPTFPEAIQDTLTQRAKDMLRIFRVRPRIHERFKSKTRLMALEPIARNVAIRRSSKSNRWILSTNTDMIFVPLNGRSISEIAQGLPLGFYHTPRLEIPEVLWESLDRRDPTGVIETVRAWGPSLHLNEIVLGSDLILYDGPGDFQLLARNDLFEFNGFDEEMLLGWHVDSNIAARMHLKYGKVGDLGPELYGYHCDHTRQVTPAHSHSRVQNDWRRFVTEVQRPDLPGQATAWGCVDDDIEEICLPKKPAAVYLQALRETLGKPLGVPKVVKYTGETYNTVDYDPPHLLPFLADVFVPMPRNTTLAWYGTQPKMLALFARVWETLGFQGKILVDHAEMQPETPTTAISLVSTSDALAGADTFVFDFGGLPSPTGQVGTIKAAVSELHRSFRRAIRAERERLSSGAAPRRIIALNAINNEYEGLVCEAVAAAATPFATHMRHGFVIPANQSNVQWLSQLSVGEAGVRFGSQIRNDPTKLGWIAYGPYKFLDEGTYIVNLNVELLDHAESQQRIEPSLFVEVRAGDLLLAVHLIRYGDLMATNHRFAFAVTRDAADGSIGLETRIAVLSSVPIAVHALSVEPSLNPTDSSIDIPAVLRIKDWLPFLRLGALGQLEERGVTAKIGSQGFVVFGPYWSLPAGCYEMIVQIERKSIAAATEHLVRADVAVADRQIVAGSFRLAGLPYDAEQAASLLRLPFELDGATPDRRLIETRIWSSGEESFTLRSLSVRSVTQQEQTNLLPTLSIGEAGWRDDSDIYNVVQQVGFVAYNRAITLRPAAYRLSIQIIAQAANHVNEQPCAIVLIMHRAEILAIEPIKSVKSESRHYVVTFEVPSSSDAFFSIEFLLQVITAADVRLQALAIEPAATPARSELPAACRLGNWLPFLQRNPIAHADPGGILVTDGEAGYAVYGPYWTLPGGDYELIATVVPYAPSESTKARVTIDVCAEGGQRIFATQQWHLGQYADAERIVECRLPFAISANLPAPSRTIETRIFTSADDSFHIRSVSVRPMRSEQERNWFAYLAVRQCGIYEHGRIRNIRGKFGWIASTHIIPIRPGHYKASVDVAPDEPGAGEHSPIGLQVWFCEELIAIGVAQGNQPLEFDVSEDPSKMGMEIRLRAITTGSVSIRGLFVERLGDVPERSSVPDVLRVGNWIPFLETRPSAVTDEHGVTVKKGDKGFAIWGPYWPLPPGHYEVVASIVPLSSINNAATNMIIDVCTMQGQRQIASQQFSFDGKDNGDPQCPLQYRVTFELTSELPTILRTIETRLYTDAAADFRIISVTVQTSPASRQSNDNLSARQSRLRSLRSIAGVLRSRAKRIQIAEKLRTALKRTRSRSQ